MTVMEEKEQILKSVPTKDDNPFESLTQWEMELKRLEDWLSSPEPESGYHEIAMPEETYQHELQLEEDGMGLAKELKGVVISKEVAKQRFNGETTELESVAQWPTSVTRGESRMGG
jgi:hypothetical protein